CAGAATDTPRRRRERTERNRADARRRMPAHSRALCEAGAGTARPCRWLYVERRALSEEAAIPQDGVAPANASCGGEASLIVAVLELYLIRHGVAAERGPD